MEVSNVRTDTGLNAAGKSRPPTPKKCATSNGQLWAPARPNIAPPIPAPRHPLRRLPGALLQLLPDVKDRRGHHILQFRQVLGRAGMWIRVQIIKIKRNQGN